MSEIIDTNVVEIKFDNSQFIDNVSQTIDTVENLKKSLQFDSNSFENLNRYASNVDLSNISNNLESLSERFSTFGIVGMTAIQRITNEVMTLGGKLVGLLAKPWRQIISGGTNRAANIANAQFQLEGIFGKSELGAAKLAMTMNADAEAIKTMTGYTEDMVVAMDAANYAVADTAYGLDSAAKAASVLATSGVDVLNFQEDLKDSSGLLRTEMQVALRSISGVAAMANSSYDEIAHVFERISGNGRIMAIDLQSLSARGLNAAATLRDYLNEIGETSNATEKDIRDMVSKGKIDFMTFAKAMDSAYGEHAKDANNTFEGAFSNMKFALSKIGADFISPLREKLIPILNDVRLVINNIRKALQFKIKFPWTEEEVSIVELFTRAITNLTNKAHEFFMMWTGGQNVLEKAMTGFSEVTGAAFSDVKKIFDEVENGTRSSSGSILELIRIAESSGSSMDDVFKTLAETMDTTEEEIRRMCRNGEISFEEFSNAISATFGNTVWDKRVKQLATVFRNLLSVVYNIASTITSIFGPAIEAFLNVFTGNGVNGVIGFTQSLADFTAKLRLSVPAQRALVKIFESIFRVLKLGLGVIKNLAISVVKILLSLSPLIDAGLRIISVLATIVSFVIDAVASSQIFTKVISILTNVLIAAGRVIISVLLLVISMVAPAIQLVGSVFSNLNKSLKSVDTRAIRRISFSIKDLVSAIGDGRFVQTIQRVISTFVYAIVVFFASIVYLFTHMGDVLTAVKDKIKDIALYLIECFLNIGNNIKNTFSAVANFIKKNFSSIGSILAAIESILALSILYRLVHFGSAINKAVSAWANKQNAEAFALAIRSIRQLAASFILLAVAALVIAAIPTDRILQAVGGMMALTLAIIGLAMAIKWVVTSFAELNKTKEKIDPLRQSMANFVNSAAVSMKNLTKGIQSFLKNIGRTGAFIALAVLILSIVAAMFVLYKAVASWASIDHDTLVTGLQRMGIVLAALTVSCAILGAACKKAGGGLIGAAVLVLAFMAALRGFASVIALYHNMEYGWKEWAKDIIKIAACLFVMAGAVALIGASCKKSGFSMMAGAIDMLAFLVVLKFMISLIDQYSQIKFTTVIGSMIKMAAVLVVFCGAIALMADALNTEKGFSAGLSRAGGRLNYKKTSQNFMGLILMMLSMAVLMKVVASSINDIKSGGFPAFIGLVILIRTVFGYLIDLVDTIGNRKINGKALVGITAMLLSLSLIFSIMTLLDPFRILTVSGGVSLVLATLSLVVERLIGISKQINKDKGKSGVGIIIAILLTLTAMIAVLAQLNWQSALAGSTGMAIILFGISSAFRIMNKVKVPDKKIAAKMLQVMLAVLAVVAIMSKLPVNDIGALWSLTGSMAVMSVVIGYVAKLLGNANLIDNSALKAFATVGVTIGAMVLAFAGAAAIAAGKESAFLGLTGCITVLSFVAVALMKLLTFINVNAKVWTSFGLFAAIMSVITGFAWAISAIAQIGDVSNTTTIMDALVKTMLGLLPVVAAIQLLTSVFALLLQNPMVMLGAAVGVGLFLGIMAIIAGFAWAVAGIAQIGDVDRTITIMEGITEMMRSLSITLLIVVAIGALGLLAIAGLAIIITAVTSILLLCGIIGGFESIRNAVMTGIAIILAVCNAIREVTEIMSNLSLEGILIFITALNMLSSINIVGLMRLAVVGTTLLVATTPIAAIGNKKREIQKGLDISKQMMTDLVEIYAMSKMLGNMNAEDIVKATKDTMKVADAMIDFSSLYIVSGLAHGLVDQRSRDILKVGAVGMAAIIDKEFRDIMGIHSDSDWGIDMAHWITSGSGHGMVDAESIANLIGGVDGMGSIITAEGTKEFAKAGVSNGATYVSSFLEVISHAGANTFGVEQGLNTLFGSLTDPSKAKKSIKSDFDDYYRALRTQQIQFDRDAKDYQRNHAGYYSPNLAGPDVSQSSLVDEFTDYGDLTNLFKSLEDMMSGLTDVSGLMDSIGGLGSSADLASRSVDELTSKIDDLMDKYENLWEDAKDRANKDLFKGVDKQGDDFLDSVQEIMDKYKSIYKDAVEKTNSEDLFAEVKDEDESFAPETLINNLEDQVNQVNELNTIIGSLSGRIADNGLRAAISNMSVDDLPELRAMYRMDDGQLRKYESMYQKKVQANQNKIQNELTGSLSQLTGQYTNVATYVATDASSNALVRNLQSQIDQLNEYNNTVSSLTTRIKDVNLREAIAHMGVESLDELKALNSMTDKQLDEYVALYNSKISQEARTIKNELSTELSTLLGEPVDISEFYLNYRGAIDDVVGNVTEKAGETAGNSIGTGMATGMASDNVVTTARNSGRDLTTAVSEGISDEEGTEKVVESTKSIVEQIVEVLQNPRNQFKESGLKVVDKIIEGLVRGRESRDFYDAVAHLCDKVYNVIRDKYETFVNVGRMITLGVAAGIRNESAVNTVKNAAISMVSSTLKEAYKTAKINSPSKVTEEMGMYLDEGLAVGLRKYSDVASDEAGEMAGNSVNAIQEAIQRMSGMLDGSIDINPVITPTLDLSEVNARSAALANMFNGRQIAVQARADDQQAEMMTQLGNILAEQNTEPRSITFNQTNNSPKALSRTEIYRQSRNAFSQLASAIQ